MRAIYKMERQQFKELRKRIGYRFYLTQAEIAEEVKVNDQTRVKVSLSNAGWAAPYKNRRVEFYLCKNYSGAWPDTEKMFGTLDQVIDVRAMLLTQRLRLSFHFQQPYRRSGYRQALNCLFLRSPDNDKYLSSRAEFSIRLANNTEGTDQNQKKRRNVFGWNPTSGANRFGSITIK